ncbi:Vps54-like protein-domain-containing protein [Xylariaceae sp. FL0016]|nr:Vps54-like protein-domain-containing protein [Xylariaceae sp. FL0016]
MFSNSAARKSVDSLSPWSPNAQNEFPFHRQPSVSSVPKMRRGSTASSIHSVGGQLDTASTSWSESVLESGQNAISTLLQPPIVRTGLLPHTSAPASSAHKPPTARDIPPVTLTSVPRVDASEFKPYLTQVGALYDQLRRIQESEDDGSDQVFRRNSRADEHFGFADDSHLKPGSRPGSSRKLSSASTRSISPIEAPSPMRATPRRRSSSGYGRKAAQGPPPLSTIPNVYFDDDFHLENPRTFDVVSERSEVVRPAPGSAEDRNAANGNAPPPRKALATNAILQEKLSWYMDTIEMHLISSISTASTTFFTALGSLRELHSEAADSVDRIKTLREELNALDQEIATTGLDIVQAKRRRENLHQLNDAVKQLKDIVESVAVCEELVDAGELERALSSIDDLENLIGGKAPSRLMKAGTPTRQLQDLRGAVALQGLNGDVSTLRFRIGKAFESRFLDVLLGDLRRHVNEVSTQDVLLRWSSSAMRSRGGTGAHSRDPSAFPAYLAKTESLRSELMPVLIGLHRSKHITVAIASYREIVLREVRNLVKRPLPTSNDDDNESMMSASTMSSKRLTQQEKSSILARNLRSLDDEDAEALFTKIYISVTETLRRLSTQVKVLFDVASSMGEGDEEPELKSPTSLKSPPLNSANRDIQEDIHLTMDMANLLGQAVDISQEKIVKILRVRTDQSTHLPLVWFLRYFTLNLYFANECEAISGRSGTSLKTIVNQHIKDFIQLHGDAEKQRLAQGMESDQWSAKDFAAENNNLLNRILESSTKDSDAWSEGSRIWMPFSEATSKERKATNGRPRAESNGPTKEKARSAIIESESFILPHSAILCLEGMSHFLHLISGIPSMASDVSSSLVAYLQLFNSRCTQLILGAGATKTAGLKNITTRHLALASQALAFISTLIPHVREFVRRHAGSGPNVNNTSVAGLMGEFDKVRRLFQEHQNNIYDKLVEIMSGRASAHARTIKGLDWNTEVDTKVNVYMEKLVTETLTLHRVLTKHLPEGTVRLIMSPVFASYKSQLGKSFEGLEVKDETATTRMKSDIEYLNARLGKIDGFGDAGDHLLNIVKSKKVQVPAIAPDTSQETVEQNGGSNTENKTDEGPREEPTNGK